MQVVVTEIFAWHDESLFLVLLCIAEKETAVLRADLRTTLGQVISERRLLREFINLCRLFDPPNVHNDSLLFLANEGKAQRDLSV